MALTALTACGSEAASDAGGRSGSSAPVITAANDWDSAPTAEMSGKLTLTAGGLQLGDDPVFWPHGTRWDEADQAVVLRDGSRIVVGQQFHGGGGAYDVDTDFTDLLGSDDAGDRMNQCVNETHANTVRLLTP
jgi:hypothetical protein